MKSDVVIEKIRNKLQDSDPTKRTVTHIFEFEFTDANVFDFKALNLYEGTCDTADAKIKISDEDFYLVGTHETTFENLLNENKVHTEGDKGAINKMIAKFQMNQKK